MNLLVPLLLRKAMRTQERPRQFDNLLNEDVSVVLNEPINLKRFKYFLENVENQVPDRIRIIKYTIEGDPILNTLVYDGQLFHLLTDNTFDRYASSDSPLVYQYTGKNISKVLDENDIDYYLDTEDGKISLYRYPLTYDI